MISITRKKVFFNFIPFFVASLSLSHSYAEPTKLRVSAEDVRELSYRLAHQVNASSFKPDVIIGIARGGLSALHYISSECGLDFRNVLTLAVTSYEGDVQQREVKFVSQPDLRLLRERQNILIVDDVLDTAKSIDFVLNHLNQHVPGLNIRIATLFYKPTQSNRTPDFYVISTPNVWINFPSEYRGNPPLGEGEEHFQLPQPDEQAASVPAEDKNRHSNDLGNR